VTTAPSPHLWHRLLCKEGFRWCAKAESAFQALQRALTTVLVLQLTTFDREFVVECDASEAGFGAVLHQGDRLVAFFSKPIALRHAKLAAYECELIWLAQAVKHWRPYLWGTPFLIHTDHYNLKFLLDQKLGTIPQHQWASKLLGFDFRDEYKPGAVNVVANALSCRDTADEGYLYSLSVPTFTLFDQLQQEISADEDLRALCADITASARDKKWRVQDGLITVAGKVYVPWTSPSLPDILEAAHGTAHEGVAKTLQRLRLDFHIPGAREWSRILCEPVLFASATSLSMST
jgi:hypothetical protein